VIIFTTKLETPIGTLLCGTNDQGVFLLDFPERTGGIDKVLQRIAAAHQASFEDGQHALAVEVAGQLQAYFKGELKHFDLPLQLSGTGFQCRVWQELLAIPYGHTRSYKQQSERIGNLKAIRAVGKANGDNCLAVIVPCHRVVASGGGLTGYAGGLHHKQWLLEHELRHAGHAVQRVLF